MIQIKHKVTGLVLLEVDSDTLVGADLSWVDIRAADLKGVNLSGTDLHRAALQGADLAGANLTSTNLRGANLKGTTLSGANLNGANLAGTDLRHVDLQGAILTGTVLDPSNRGIFSDSGEAAHGFEIDPETGMLFGYRTKNSVAMNPEFSYEVGEEYSAPWFSTCESRYHPGLYLCKSICEARHFLPTGHSIIKVRFLEGDLHRAGGKFRVRKFTVVEEVEL